MKFYKLAAAILALSLSASSFAITKSVEANVSDDYDADDYGSASYYENEGRILLKIRGLGIITKAKQKSLPAPTSERGKSSASANKAFIDNGFGIEAATVLFFNDNFATELSTGGNFFKTSKAAASQMAYNYSDTATAGKKKNIYGIPLNFTLQYHVAPFGAIRPYIGAGYNATYFITKSKDYKVKNAIGPIIQLGVDFVMTDDTVLTLDAKKYFLKPKITYKQPFIASEISTKLPMDPLVVSVGMGWKF